MSLRPKLTHEEACAIVRERINRAHVGQGWTADEWREFALNCIDVLCGEVGALTPQERERIERWRSLDA